MPYLLCFHCHILYSICTQSTLFLLEIVLTFKDVPFTHISIPSLSSSVSYNSINIIPNLVISFYLITSPFSLKNFLQHFLQHRYVGNPSKLLLKPISFYFTLTIEGEISGLTVFSAALHISCFTGFWLPLCLMEVSHHFCHCSLRDDVCSFSGYY